MPDDAPKAKVESSTKVWIGSTVISVLGLLFGVNLIIIGSCLRWQADSVLGLYNVSGLHYHNVISGDGKLTLALGIITAVALLFGWLAQNKYGFMISVVCSGLALAFAIYEMIYISTRPGVTSTGHGIDMVLGGAFPTLLCSLGGYLMMVERGREKTAPEEPVSAEPCRAV